MNNTADYDDLIMAARKLIKEMRDSPIIAIGAYDRWGIRRAIEALDARDLHRRLND